MHDTKVRHWTRIRREAERELDAATGASQLKAAGRRLMMAKREMKRLELEAASEAAANSG